MVHILGPDNVEVNRLSRYQVENPCWFELNRMVSRQQGDFPSLHDLPPRPFQVARQSPAGGLVQVFPPAPSVPCSPQDDLEGGSRHRDSTVVTPKGVVYPGPISPCGPDSVLLECDDLLLGLDESCLTYRHSA